jgi:hypothetical protein
MRWGFFRAIYTTSKTRDSICGGMGGSQNWDVGVAHGEIVKTKKPAVMGGLCEVSVALGRNLYS